jgi:hypothetical protein
VWEFGDVIVRGSRSLRDAATGRRADGLAGPGSHTMHILLNTAVTFESRDRAVAESNWLFVRVVEGVLTRCLGGQYRDQLTKTRSGWRISRRTITSL